MVDVPVWPRKGWRSAKACAVDVPECWGNHALAARGSITRKVEGQVPGARRLLVRRVSKWLGFAGC